MATYVEHRQPANTPYLIDNLEGRVLTVAEKGIIIPQEVKVVAGSLSELLYLASVTDVFLGTSVFLGPKKIRREFMHQYLSGLKYIVGNSERIYADRDIRKVLRKRISKIPEEVNEFSILPTCLGHQISLIISLCKAPFRGNTLERKYYRGAIMPSYKIKEVELIGNSKKEGDGEEEGYEIPYDEVMKKDIGDEPVVTALAHLYHKDNISVGGIADLVFVSRDIEQITRAALLWRLSWDRLTRLGETGIKRQPNILPLYMGADGDLSIVLPKDVQRPILQSIGYKEIIDAMLGK